MITTHFAGNSYKEGVSTTIMSTVVSRRGKNGRTYPLFSTDSAIKYSFESLELETQYPLISENNISEPVDALRKFHHDTSAVSDYSCSNIEEPVSLNK